MRNNNIAFPCIAPVLLLTMGCFQVDGLDRAKMGHGITLGDRIAPVSVSCDSVGGQTIGLTGTVRIVTFATPYDCALCSEHLSSMIDVVDQIPNNVKPGVIVVWAPNETDITRSFRSIHKTMVLCRDIVGDLWSQYNITNTPFTVVLSGNKVVYVTDGMLAADERKQFLADIEYLVARAP